MRAAFVSTRVLTIGMALFSAIKADETPAVQAKEIIEIEGRILFITGTTNLQVRTDSTSYRLLPTREGQALFADTGLHSRTLLLKGERDQKFKTFAVTGNLHEIRDGTIYELYYYCDICSIETSFPGPCLCCREPVELRERKTNRKRTQQP